MTLSAPMVDGALSLLPFAPEHVAPLRLACEQDRDIWAIYPVNMLGDDFDAEITRFHGGNAVRFAVLWQGRVVGTTAYLNPDPANGTVMIGATYIEPAVRGSGLNAAMKRLMLDRAFAEGFWRIEFTVDTRNTRSMAAMAKLGATLEGTLRRNRVTWTGHVRDTALYSILAEEWLTLRGYSGGV